MPNVLNERPVQDQYYCLSILQLDGKITSIPKEDGGNVVGESKFPPLDKSLRP